MTRRPALVVLALTAALATALTGATQGAGQAAGAPSSHGAATSADRGTPGKWTKVSKGSVGTSASPSLVRGGNGDLHLVYTRLVGNLGQVMHSTIHTNGSTGVQNAVTSSAWSVMDLWPAVVSSSAGLRVVFGGQLDTGSGFWDNDRLYTATADGAGSTWTLPMDAVSNALDGGASGLYGTAAVNLADGTPLAAFVLSSTLTWHVGTDASADATYTDPHASLYDVSLVRDGSDVWAAWFQYGDNAASSGIFAKQIYPTVGATLKAPGSSEGMNTLKPDSRVALAARVGGGVFAAYCVGYPTCAGVRVWKVGTTKTTNIAHSKYVSSVAMSPARSGRLWIAWANNIPKVQAVRTGQTGLVMGAVQNAGIPKGGAAYSLAIDGTIGRGDIVLNDGDGMWHTQVFAGLTVKASPTSWRHHTKKKVTFTVTDAHAGVAGAKVAVGSQHCTTKANGTCVITFAKSFAQGKHTARATKSGYAAATAGLKVK